MFCFWYASRYFMPYWLIFSVELTLKKNDMPVRHKTIKRRRIRTVIERLMLIAGHLTVHARKVLLALGRSNPWANTFLRIWRVLSEGWFFKFDFLRGFLCPFGFDLSPFYFDDPLFTWIFMMLLLQNNRSGCVAVFRVEFCGLRIMTWIRKT